MSESNPAFVTNLRTVLVIDNSIVGPMFSQSDSQWSKIFVYSAYEIPKRASSGQLHHGESTVLGETDSFETDIALFCSRHGLSSAFILPSALQTPAELDSFGRYGGVLHIGSSDLQERSYARPVDYNALSSLESVSCSGLPTLAPLDQGFPLAGACSDAQLDVLARDSGLYNPFLRQMVLPEEVEQLGDESFALRRGISEQAEGAAAKPDTHLTYCGVPYSRTDTAETLRRIRTLRMPLSTPGPLAAFVERLLPILEPPNQDPIRWNPEAEDPEVVCDLALRYSGGDGVSLPPVSVIEPVKEDQIKYPE